MPGPKEKPQPTTRHADMLLAVKQEADAVIAEARAVERETNELSDEAARHFAPSPRDLLEALDLVAALCARILEEPGLSPAVAETVTQIKTGNDGFRQALAGEAPLAG